ncbi:MULTISPECIES: helix-hairpin-helix domain-containing protein [unclassified Acidovorax]|uniref:ComEA family DNA-binding protein n=1 Tax=unclassified Acidovorax TaxID=2684926 RepID=UPI0015A1B2D3|nr:MULTISPECIES: helix-hairpin-helix domain-containing protein [unclassified Acidovorax]QLA80330.1 helix-hairpin-helix domain-containing protein [Acidovorax sp. JMULE5]
MFKKILLIITLLYAAAAFAAVDVNKATAAELDGIKGIGPGLSTKILDERKNGNFKDWSDFIARVGGVGEKTAAKFSTEGLTVNGKKFSAAAVAKAEAKASAKAEKADKRNKDTASKGKKDEKPADAAAVVQTPAAPATAATAADSATKK